MAGQFSAMLPTLAPNPASNGVAAPVTAGPRPEAVETTPPPSGQPSDVPASAGPTGKPWPLARATMVEPPRVPKIPVSPVPLRNMAIGFIAGLLLAIAVALTREAGDRTVRTRAKLEELSGLPTLAELPGKRGGTPRFGTDTAFDDAVRGMRTRLLRAMGPNARQVLVAGPFGGEGTTTTAMNLALALAEMGEDALLVEGDSRRHVIAGLLRVESGRGWPTRSPTPPRPPRW